MSLFPHFRIMKIVACTYTIVVDIYSNMLFCGEYTLDVYLLFIILAFHEKSTCKGDCDNDGTNSGYVFDDSYFYLHNEKDKMYFRSNFDSVYFNLYLCVAEAVVQIITWLMGVVKVKSVKTLNGKFY